MPDRDRLAALLHAFAINCGETDHDATAHHRDADSLVAAGVMLRLQWPEHGEDCICSVCYVRDNP